MLCKKLLTVNFFGKKFFYVNMDVYFQNIVSAVEAAIMQAKVWLSHKKL